MKIWYGHWNNVNKVAKLSSFGVITKSGVWPTECAYVESVTCWMKMNESSSCMSGRSSASTLYLMLKSPTMHVGVIHINTSLWTVVASSCWMAQTPPPCPAARGTLMNVYPLGISSAIICLSLYFFSHVSIMANNIMSMPWSVTNSLMVKVLFLTDRTLMIAAKRVLFAHIWLCVEMCCTDHSGKVICTLVCWRYMSWQLLISLYLMVRLFAQQVQRLSRYVCIDSLPPWHPCRGKDIPSSLHRQ